MLSRAKGVSKEGCAVALAVLSFASSVYADPIELNGSFELGLLNWEVTIPEVVSSRTGQLAPTGFATLVESFRFDGTGADSTGIRTAVHGDSFAVIGTGETGAERGGELEMTLSQTISLDAGEGLAGWVFF
jgi:hypothetical protein